MTTRIGNGKGFQIMLTYTFGAKGTPSFVTAENAATGFCLGTSRTREVGEKRAKSILKRAGATGFYLLDPK